MPESSAVKDAKEDRLGPAKQAVRREPPQPRAPRQPKRAKSNTPPRALKSPFLIFGKQKQDLTRSPPESLYRVKESRFLLPCAPPPTERRIFFSLERRPALAGLQGT